jgi:hypothetical protein
MTLEERINKKIEDKLKEVEQTKKKTKKFRLPFGKKVGVAKKKMNYITLVKLNENGNVKFDVVPITNQTILEDKIPRLATSKYVFYYKKNPMIFLPSWSVKPFCPEENLKESLEDGSNVKGYAILLERMQKEQLGVKKPMSGLLKIGIGLVIVGIIAYALISGGV